MEYVTRKVLETDHRAGKHRGMANTYAFESLTHGVCGYCHRLIAKGVVLTTDKAWGNR